MKKKYPTQALLMAFTPVPRIFKSPLPKPPLVNAGKIGTVRFYHQTVDVRKSRVGRTALVQFEAHREPFTGKVFVFHAASGDWPKLSYWDSTDLVTAHKRHEKAAFGSRW